MAAVRYYGEAKMLFGVSRGSFIPAPNVDSAVIRIDVEKKYSLSPEDEKFFFKVVKAAFSQRRKTLANSLSSMLSADKKHIYEALSENNLSENSRVEQLGMESLIAFSLTLKKLISG